MLRAVIPVFKTLAPMNFQACVTVRDLTNCWMLLHARRLSPFADCAADNATRDSTWCLDSNWPLNVNILLISVMQSKRRNYLKRQQSVKWHRLVWLVATKFSEERSASTDLALRPYHKIGSDSPKRRCMYSSLQRYRRSAAENKNVVCGLFPPVGLWRGVSDWIFPWIFMKLGREVLF